MIVRSRFRPVPLFRRRTWSGTLHLHDPPAFHPTTYPHAHPHVPRPPDAPRALTKPFSSTDSRGPCASACACAWIVGRGSSVVDPGSSQQVANTANPAEPDPSIIPPLGATIALSGISQVHWTTGPRLGVECGGASSWTEAAVPIGLSLRLRGRHPARPVDEGQLPVRQAVRSPAHRRRFRPDARRAGRVSVRPAAVRRVRRRGLRLRIRAGVHRRAALRRGRLRL